MTNMSTKKLTKQIHELVDELVQLEKTDVIAVDKLNKALSELSGRPLLNLKVSKTLIII